MTPSPPAAVDHRGAADATAPRPGPRTASLLRRAPLRLLVALSVAGLAGCGGSKATESLSETTVPVATAAPEAATIGARGFCGDGTDSVNPAALESAVASLAATVEGWVPAGGNHAAGTAPVPALSLMVRKVRSGSSVGLEGQVADVEIPAVPGVIPQPDVTDPGYLDLTAAFQSQSAAFDAAVGAGGSSRTGADTGAALIRKADWTAPQSEIAGCLEGLARITDGPTAASWRSPISIRTRRPSRGMPTSPACRSSSSTSAPT